MATYPGKDIEREANGIACPLTPADATAAAWDGPAARIVAVEPETPADDAGFEAGCYLTSVDGRPLRDIIDWRWLASDDVISVGYIDLDGEVGEVELEREPGEDWGFAFDGVLFDPVKLCRNACVFCFMRQLPGDVRPSLVLRDDDFRLSFLSGTFVTLTNLTPEDEARIVEQHISPLRVSLHASNPELRRRMIGRHADHGLAALGRLLDAGIEAHAQIVLMPGVNDGDALRETLEWAWKRPGLGGVGIVPLGFTKHQTALQESFTTPEAAKSVIEVIRPFQERARAERGTPWVFAADEFYVNAYGADTPAHIPPASDYGDYDMFEDGIGIVRSYVDEFGEAVASGLAARTADALAQHNLVARYVVGEAMQPFLDAMIASSPLVGRLVPLTVRNSYFGGNVNVTGLLCACDIVPAIAGVEAKEVQGEDAGCLDRVSSAATETADDVLTRGRGGGSRAGCAANETVQWTVSPSEPLLEHVPPPRPRDAGSRQLFLLPKVIFNDDGVTLDDMTVQDIEKAADVPVHVVSCNPLDYLPEIIELAKDSF
ncbi:DUF512 domain-containing protein [Adlercreutzia sp. R25]|uniref:DUF512 domain-containing protein n=1 Tax=Adlercreutzia shanghongiae TaxID=3111773 RepID=UPI002DBDC947|nr:DUF512 domain-containing protein [Adlercreutzia sp. R25]MEC4272510.1 DUF512 domain-containing protein [Adlercreutzia sp. R25]